MIEQAQYTRLSIATNSFKSTSFIYIVNLHVLSIFAIMQYVHIYMDVFPPYISIAKPRCHIS